jgi:hypothetical protein
MHIGFWWESHKERVQYEDLEVDRRIWVLEKWDGVIWTGLIWLRQGLVRDSCEHSKQPLVSIKCLEIFE